MLTDSPIMEVTKNGRVSLMDAYLKQMPHLPAAGALIQGDVIGKDRLTLYIDLPPYGTGIIFGREYLNARELIKEINPGDIITAKVITPEGENGYLELSLKEAKQALLWSEAKRAIENKEVFTLKPKSVNKGGLIFGWRELDGFLPTSQLKAEHYPKVPDGDKDKIMEELKELMDQDFEISIINAEPRENKLIFSERTPGHRSRQEIIAKYNIGDIVTGEISGVVDFGAFVKLEEGFEGLVHISEIDWSLVENPKLYFQVGEPVKAKIIEIKDDKVSLSVKALKKNPWEEAANKYKKGEKVSGVIIKYNKHGALASIEEGVAGLVHISEFGNNEENLRRQLTLGKSYQFTIAIFEPKGQKLILSTLDKPLDRPERKSTAATPGATGR